MTFLHHVVCPAPIRQTEYDSIWDLIEAQLGEELKPTNGGPEVQLVYVRALY